MSVGKEYTEQSIHMNKTIWTLEKKKEREDEFHNVRIKRHKLCSLWYIIRVIKGRTVE